MTPPRIRGLIDRVARHAQMVCYAKGPDKFTAKSNLAQAKVEALRAFALVAQDSKLLSDLGNSAVRQLRADFDAQAAELAEARELLCAASTLFGPLCTDSTQRDWAERIDAFLEKGQ